MYRKSTMYLPRPRPEYADTVPLPAMQYTVRAWFILHFHNVWGNASEIAVLQRSVLLIKSDVESVCDAIHTTYDIHFSRRQKSDVSTAEATGVLLDCKRLNVSQYTSIKIYICLFINH